MVVKEIQPGVRQTDGRTDSGAKLIGLYGTEP